MNTFRLTVSTPDGNLLDEDVTFLLVRGAEGDLAILPGHIPFVTVLKPGVCRVEWDDDTERVAHAENGILTVSPDKVTLLSGTFRWTDDETE